MKNVLVSLLVLVGSVAFAQENNQCHRPFLTKVCTTEKNGTQYDVRIIVYDKDGKAVDQGRLVQGVSLQEVIQILDSRACD